MPDVKFDIRFIREEDPEGPIELDGEKYSLMQNGAEEAEFLISPNPGENLKPLALIVSGGELSRIMLALKTLNTEKQESAVLIFDEVDTGIGGDIGHSVGETLSKLAETRQIIVVTHLPQIAQKADSHYSIEKFEKEGRTAVNVRKIAGKDRIAELTRMHGGKEKIVIAK
jgi:DNA repair protein RecN (Recombination protein N)